MDTLPQQTPPLLAQGTLDAQHLDQLKIAHFVVGGLHALFGCFPLFHVAIGLMFMFSGGGGKNMPPAFFGAIFVLIGGVMFLLMQVAAWCTIYSGKMLAARQKYWFSFVVACVQCAFMPLGTILGVFTIIVLSRESVKRLYGLPR